MTVANFTRKPVGSLTLGEKLRKVRTDNRISLAEVFRVTGIQVKYLEALESGAYGKLPPEVYVRGFLRGYASFLGIPEDAIIKLYDRERSIRDNLTKPDITARFQFRSPAAFQFSLSARGMVVSVIALVVLGFFSYLYFEFQSFVSEPRLVILSPSDGDTVTEAKISVRGETDPRAVVRINEGETTVDERGLFSEDLSLDAGLNVISISATNRFGKTRERTISVSAALPDRGGTDAVLPDPTKTNAVSISLRATAPATVFVRADGETVWNGKLSAGEEKPFVALGKIEVSSDIGNVILIRQGDGTESALSADTKSSTAIFGPNGRE
ncbi:MAG: helix-turn-helix domain-containing protein [Candidatus Moraniibacteriota bacterium]